LGARTSTDVRERFNRLSTTNPYSIDGVLVQWGDRLFYPNNRVVRPHRELRLRALSMSQCAATIRQRIASTIVRRSPQIMVKVTGGGRGMKAIAAHFRYISKNGRLDIEDDQGNVSLGKAALRELTDDWRFGGSLIGDESLRREAPIFILSMPCGTDPLIVQRAAREFAQTELTDHKYVMVLHDHQANLHMHLSARAESKAGRRLNPRKTDLHRWRETFAEKLRGWGIDAKASRQPTHRVSRNYDTIWRVKARKGRRPRKSRSPVKIGDAARASRSDALEAWRGIAAALGSSNSRSDRVLTTAIARHIAMTQRFVRLQPDRQAARTAEPDADRDRSR
jgi:hypothetical protein